MIEKILERLEEKRNDAVCVDDEEYYIGKTNAFEEAIEIVQEVAKEGGNGWIPCSEQFPRSYSYVLVCDREGDIYIASMYENEIFGKVWRQWNGGELREDWVIAWQPLPAPYQKGE